MRFVCNQTQVPTDRYECFTLLYTQNDDCSAEQKCLFFSGLHFSITIFPIHLDQITSVFLSFSLTSPVGPGTTLECVTWCARARPDLDGLAASGSAAVGQFGGKYLCRYARPLVTLYREGNFMWTACQSWEGDCVRVSRRTAVTLAGLGEQHNKKAPTRLYMSIFVQLSLAWLPLIDRVIIIILHSYSVLFFADFPSTIFTTMRARNFPRRCLGRKSRPPGARLCAQEAVVFRSGRRKFMSWSYCVV